MKSDQRKRPSRSKARLPATSPQSRVWIAFIAALVVSGLVGATWLARHQATNSGSSRATGASQTPSLDRPGSNGVTLSSITLSQTNEPPTALELVNQGTALVTQGRIDEAIAAYLKAMQLNPEDEEVHFNLAYAYAQKGRLTQAIHHYMEALRLFPDYAEAHNNLGNLLVGQRQFDKAIEHFSAALRANPEYPSALNNFGRALAEQGKTREAVTQFSEAVRLNPDYVEAHFNLASAYFTLGSYDEAAAQYQQVLRLQPDFQPAVTALARVREKQRGGTAR